MTHPLTPREKVRKVIIDVMKPKDADITLGRIDTCTDAILTALASGSGDHAELARDLRAFEGSDDLGNGDFTVCEFAADALDALLAENAALRASASVIEPELGDLQATNSDLSARLTEAERKLAEAVEWRPIETAPRDGTWILGSWGEAHPVVFGVVMWDGDQWRESDDVVSDPTHWLPLPPAPGAEDE